MLGLASVASGGLVAGGGVATSDCYAELEVLAIDNGTEAVKHNKKVMCADGDPCDTGPCGDGVCDLKVRLCWNQADPHVAACIPPARLDSLLLRGPLAALLVMPNDLEGTACSDEYMLSVATKRAGTRPGRVTVRLSAKAPAGSEPPLDVDVIRLVCTPRPFETCPMPTTTTTPPDGTTTTVPTTTTLIEATSTTTTTTRTTTTRRRRTTTTATLPPTTTTTAVVPTTTAPPPTTSLVPTTTTEAPTTSLEVTTTTDTTTTSFLIDIPIL